MKSARPWSFILFREACVSRAQVTRLCDELREAVGHDAMFTSTRKAGALPA
ncbi:MAG: hypothetical protein WDM79_17270 [Terricaulis sp.]